MKNLLLGFFIIATISVNGQGNNPYDGFGKDYFQSIANVAEDIKINGFRGVDQKSLDYYSNLATVKVAVTTEVAKSVYEVSGTKGLNVREVIESSKYSEEWQQFALRSLKDISSYSDEERAVFFHDIVEQVLASKMPDSEKELILKLVSVTNQAYANYSAFGDPMGETGLAGRIDCGTEGPEGTTLIHPAGCVGAGALIGGVIGGTICGPLCAVGGAIVFGILTAITVC